jgi:hypothetical protein
MDPILARMGCWRPYHVVWQDEQPVDWTPALPMNPLLDGTQLRGGLVRLAVETRGGPCG